MGLEPTTLRVLLGRTLTIFILRYILTGHVTRVKLEKFGDNVVAVHVLVCERNTVPTPSLCSIHTAKRLGSQGVKLTLSI